MENSQSKPKLTSEAETTKITNGTEAMSRGSWDSKLEFILTCIGYSVGLGNVWRFPYLVFKNGGGAFLIPYWIMQLFVGMPLFYLELSFGQFASLGPITIWRSIPLFKGFGYAMVLCTFFITIYYNVIITYCITYLFASMTSTLPYTVCDKEYGSTDCYDGTNNETLLDSGENVNSTSIQTIILLNKTITPSEDYFIKNVLNQSSGIEVPGYFQWKLSLNLLLAWVIVFIVLVRGIKSLGKVVYFTAIFPYFVLLALLIRGSTLEGSLDGIKYYLTPKWHKLAESSVWSDAATQVFYSLSVSSGGLITMSSYNNFKNNCLRDSILVPLIDCFTSFFSGFVIFTVLGFMAKVKGVDVDTVVKGGPGLAFIAYPEAITKMPSPTVWAIFFFLMMITIGFSSQFSLVETVVSSLMDEWQDKLRRNWKTQTSFRVCVCLISFLLGLPMTTQAGMYIVYLVDTSVSGFPLLILGFTECIILCYVYGYKRFANDIEMMIGKKPSIYWRLCWCFITPLILFIVIVSKAIQYKSITFHSYIYPRWAQTLGWLMVIFPLMIIPVYFIVKHCQNGGYWVMVKCLKPQPNWGPSEAQNRTGRYAAEVDDDDDSERRGNPVTTVENIQEVQRRQQFSETEGSGGVENVAFESDCHQNVTPLPNYIATTDSTF